MAWSERIVPEINLEELYQGSGIRSEKRDEALLLNASSEKLM